MKKIVILAATLLAGTATQASAAVVTKSFQIVASGFEGGAPMGTVKGIFEFTYDDTKFLTPPALVNVTGFNVPFAGPALFSFNKMNDAVVVGNNIGFGSYTVGPATPGFGFYLKGLSGTPSLGSLTYSAGGKLWHATEFSVSAPSGVPETSTWAMLIGGVGAVGGVLRTARRHRSTGRAFA
ncbi:MAG: hypothetical protein ABW023_07300 [Sphingomonas sp.]